MKRLHQDVYVGLLIFAVALIFFVQSFGFPEGANIFPYYIFGLLGVFGLIIAFMGFKKSDLSKVKEGPVKDEINFSMIKLPLAGFLIIVLYTLMIQFLGFFVATSIFITLFLLFYKVKKPILMIALVIGVNVFIYLLFVYQLNVRLPGGLLF
ncbi:tripartite tricarboxylate transporter TctB family protein [Bhargavaea ginsengi]|uniref:tripartite tricarboxylate transporter TctB family protein n=1 Tax=Bhargavaea ginsengi TaxID=426757 RepID=UPI002042587E|nr:tripartite tricarboxylate transporter TctB family protein [Bhargavaea ginsengi]